MATTSRSAAIHETFQGFRSELDEYNDRRERLIKASRDVTTLSKRLIFHLHRIPADEAFRKAEGTGVETTGLKLTREAQQKRDEIVAVIAKVAQQEGLDAAQAQRYDRALGPGLEEFIEAISFLHFLQSGTLISIEQVQALFVAPDGTTVLPITPRRFLLGISDLTGEMMRYAISAIGSAKADSQAIIGVTLDTLRLLVSAMDPFVPLVPDFRSKQRVTVQSMRKIEDLAYAIRVRSAEYGSDPAALREMVKRTLAHGSGDAATREQDE